MSDNDGPANDPAGNTAQRTYNLHDEIEDLRRSIAELSHMLADLNRRLEKPDADARQLEDQLKETHVHPLMDDEARLARRPLFRQLMAMSEKYGQDRRRRRDLTGQIKSLVRDRETLERRISREATKRRTKT